MNILYLANIRLPTEKAHGLHIMKACEALVREGHTVRLVVPRRWTPVTQSPNEYYGIENTFPITYLPVPDVVRLGKIGFYMHMFLFALMAAWEVRRSAVDVVFSRDEVALYVASLFSRRPIVWESHDGRWNSVARAVVRHALGIVVVSQGLKDFYVAQGVSEDRIHAVANGIELADFAHPLSKQEARIALGLPQSVPVALYAGRLDGWKGTDTLIAAAKLLAPDVLVAFIGGEDRQVDALRQAHPNLLFLGSRPYTEVTQLQTAADVLVLPNTGKNDISVRFTSPLKLLGYMASGVPVVASDLPSVRELVGNDSAHLVPADDAALLAEGIRTVLADRGYGKRLAERARAQVEQYTWQNRAHGVVRFIETHIERKTRVLAIYRGVLTESRGTPIRVRTLLSGLAQDTRFTLTVASWNSVSPIDAAHIHLSNNKVDDVRTLMSAARDVDIVLGHTMSAWYYMALLRVLRPVKIVLEMHGFIEEESRFYGDLGWGGYVLSKMFYAVFYRMCSAITTCSENAQEILSRFNAKTVAIYGGVDTDLFRPDVAPLPGVIRPQDSIVLGYAGNARKWQGLEFLIEAFRRLRAQDSSFVLAILTSERKGIPDEPGIQVFDPVPHEEVPQFLAACDVLIIPRLDDRVSRVSFASKLPEYMAMGKPVIASATSDAHRIIADGKNGLIFTPGDIDGFIACALALKDSETRSRIGAQARMVAETRLSWPFQVVILANILRSISSPHVKG